MLDLTPNAAAESDTFHRRRDLPSYVPVPAAAGRTGSSTVEGRSAFFATLQRVGCGQAVIRHGCLIELCATGRAILERECATEKASPEQLHAAIKVLMRRAGARFPLGSMSWLATSLKEGYTIFLNQAGPVGADGTTIVILLDLDARPEPNPVTLRNLFGFTAAETRLAVELAQGRTLNDIAQAHQLRRTTIRSQLASLFVKTQTNRQSELIALLGRVTLLP